VLENLSCQYAGPREAEGPSEIFVRAPKSYVFPRHWHTSAEHLVMVTGRLDSDIEGSGHVSIGPGGYLYLPGTTPHSARCGDDAPCLFYIGLDKPLDVNLVK